MSYNKYKFLIIGTTEIESFSNHISENLIQMGHDVIQYNPSIKLKKGHSKIIVYYNKILFTCFFFFVRYFTEIFRYKIYVMHFYYMVNKCIEYKLFICSITLNICKFKLKVIFR